MNDATQPIAQPEHPGTVVIVGDDPSVLCVMTHHLAASPHVIVSCSNTQEAISHVREGNVQVVVFDIVEDDLSILELLHTTRQHDPDLPVLLVTDRPDFGVVTKAIEQGAMTFLLKPINQHAFVSTVRHATLLRQLVRARRLATSLFDPNWLADEYSGIDSIFERALNRLWIAFQPIVRASDRTVYGYDALIRSDEPALVEPAQIVDAAERFGAVRRLGHAVRARAATEIIKAECSYALFVHLHPDDLLDPDLVDEQAVLTSIAGRVVLEIAERAIIVDGVNARSQAIKLRSLGFRTAIENYGSGQATLRTFCSA